MFEKRISLYEYVLLLIVSALAFLASSPFFYPFLNSDIAVHILMSNDFSFKNDLYYWGQDRLGSFVPMCAFLLKQYLNISPIWAVSIVKWGVLTSGVVAFWTFIPARIYRFVFCLIWFFPVYELRYLLLPGHPYAEQLALFGISLICFDRALFKNQKSYIPWFFLTASFSVWVSDFSVVLYLTLFIVFAQPMLKTLVCVLKQHKKLFALTLAVTMGCAILLLYAKLNAPRDPTYTTQAFASIEQLTHSINLLLLYTKKAITFQSITFWNSLVFYSTLILCVITLLWHKAFSGWTKFFFTASILGFLFIVSLRWLAINYVMLKYFIPVFILLWMGILSTPMVTQKILRMTMASLSLCLATACVASLLISYQANIERPICFTDLQKIKSQKHRHFIGDYWYSYVLSISSPNRLLATPRDGDTMRNFALKTAVLNSDTVTIVTNDWFNMAPDTLMQYNHLLIKSDNAAWSEGGFQFANYTNLGKLNPD